MLSAPCSAVTPDFLPKDLPQPLVPSHLIVLLMAFIEWHERMMPVHSGKTAEFFAQLAELRCNVTVLMWP